MRFYFPGLVVLAALSLLAYAQAPARVWTDKPVADQIQALVSPLPKLPLKRTDFPLTSAVAQSFGMISWMASDPRSGTIYMFQRGPGADPIVAVDRQGRVLRSWGQGLFKMPHSIRIDNDGNIWTVDSVSSLVMKFTPDGKKLLEISVGEQPNPGRTSGTADIAFGPNGRIFIADGYGNARILEYSAEGKRVREWGTHGNGPGQFNVPHSIVIDKDGVVYVADRENGRIQRFKLDGQYIGEWGGLGKPMNLRIRENGSLLVSTGYRNQPGQAPDWLGWIVEMDKRTGKLLAYVEVGDDTHAMEVAEDGGLLTGGETNRVSAVHWFRP